MSIPVEIKSIIDQLMVSPRFKIQWREHLIQSKWTEWVGKRMALHIRPWKLKDNKLIVLIDDDNWKQPLEEFKEKILKKMEKDLGSLTIRGFSIVMDKKRIPQRNQSQNRIDKNQHPPTNLSKENPILSRALEAELNLIKDPSLQTTLKRLMSKAQFFNQKGNP